MSNQIYIVFSSIFSSCQLAHILCQDMCFLNLLLIGGQLLYNALLVSVVQQRESATNIHVSSLLNPLLTPHPIPSLQVVEEHQVEFPLLQSNFSLAICLTYANVYVSMLLYQFVTPFPSPTVSTRLFSMSVSLFLPCTQIHQYHFSRFHIHA